MMRHIPRLVILTAFTILTQHLASASDAVSDATIKLAMGPMSAPLKNQNQGQQVVPDATGTTPKVHHRAKPKSKAQ